MTLFRTIIIFFIIIFNSSPLFAGEWINPKDLIGDPAIARLQQGRKQLKEYEEDDIKKYGYTGLELITYVDINTRPDRCWDKFERAVVITASGHIKVYEWLWKEKYYYKKPVSLLTYDGIRPGDVMRKFTGIYLAPPKKKYRGYLYYVYLTSKDKNIKDKEGWAWVHELRRYRRSPTTAKDDYWLGSVLSYDDMFLRRPWEEEHRIIGEDTINGQNCFVVESRNCVDSDYYLGKRVTWVEKSCFLDLHEEQFDKKGRCTLIIDKTWEHAKTSNHWVRSQWNCINLVTKNRIVRQNFNWEVGQDFGDGDFLPAAMSKEYIWKKRPDLSSVKSTSDLPKLPTARRDFWRRLKANK